MTIQICPHCKKAIFKQSRTNPQNSYYWGIIIPIISDYTGYTEIQTHEVLKSEFLPEQLNLGNKTVITNKSTTELSTIEFNEYTEQCRQWGAEQGLNIPEPNEEVQNGNR